LKTQANQRNAAGDQAALHALPEMYFGNNELRVRHLPSGAELKFDSKGALDKIEVGSSGTRWKTIKVAAAEIWQQRRDAQRLPTDQRCDSGFEMYGSTCVIFDRPWRTMLILDSIPFDCDPQYPGGRH
jgi:hypothetical protein